MRSGRRGRNAVMSRISGLVAALIVVGLLLGCGEEHNADAQKNRKVQEELKVHFLDVVRLPNCVFFFFCYYSFVW